MGWRSFLVPRWFVCAKAVLTLVLVAAARAARCDVVEGADIYC